MSQKPARVAMPKVTAWIDSLREAFGSDAIDAQIRATTRDGLPGFHAEEGGQRVGLPIPAAGKAFSVAEIVIEHPPERPAHVRR